MKSQQKLAVTINKKSPGKSWAKLYNFRIFSSISLKIAILFLLLVESS